MMEENIPKDLTEEQQKEIFAEVDRVAAETAAEFEIINESGPDLSELPPDVLAALMASREKYKSRGGTKVGVPRAVRNKKRKAQRRARKITCWTGGGRTTAKRTRKA